MDFIKTEPALANYWRAIILFGLNSASYKFALAKALIEIGNHPGKDLITLDELAEPFSRHLCEHLTQVDKQGSRPTGRFLDTCRQFNAGDISKGQLLEVTRKLGFQNVIDAFHNVNQGELPKRFFIDERRSSGGIRLTEQLYELFSQSGTGSLLHETEARWRLVETAWELGLSRNLISVEADTDQSLLFARAFGRRIDITSSRDALNGYQKGKCFYCFATITVEPGSENLADVDHFLPHALKLHNQGPNWDGVWNLVLACSGCNRGAEGKFARVPALPLLRRLHKRNEYLISSHHPLRETLIRQTGGTAQERGRYLQQRYDEALSYLVHTWQPASSGDPAF
ncbi:HNH endonuclease domain-containing protein [Marinobacterium mangrovicola]|uniref:HNH endonuclease n=1 Tax=Marinobacterium mangrovicola TaxID=1476959 RepID=A0A4R1GGR9_9GAMM|nr:HNH endonuclease domain-containing protein [Marinobacterium mangrovicola]TCK06130.1 HNH endonuclease [Marinobacterium mangrovicola]